MFQKILIANRGEIACRVIKTAKRLGIATVALYSDADRRSLHVSMADEAVHIGPAPARDSYINQEAVLAAIKQTGADAVHPGYGFLSENASFAGALAQMNVAFIGPGVEAISAMGDKITSKKIASKAGVSTVPGHMGLIETPERAEEIASEIGYPVMIKASAGGGGKGMRIAWSAQDVREGFIASQNEAASSFGDDRIFIEKFVTKPRHIEIQVLCDAHGNGVHLGERECSIQRRNQKVIEEAPSPFLDAQTRELMGAQALALAHAVGYQSAGTVEFIVDEAQNFYFLEMNTRLQVEHPVTELITGIDLVEEMIRISAGEKLRYAQEDISLTGWAIESRLYAEDPYRGFLPSTGRLTRYRPPTEQMAGPLSGEHSVYQTAIRNDTGVYEGGEISMFYDPMIAKLCSWGETRSAAIECMRDALDQFEIEGIGHNIPFLSAVMDHPDFVSGDITTAFIEEQFSGGFKGVDLAPEDLRAIAAACAAMFRVSEIRRTRISGRLDNHTRRIGRDWVVQIGGQSFDLGIEADRDGADIHFEQSGDVLRVSGEWSPGMRQAPMQVAARDYIFKVDERASGFRIRYRGADLEVRVLSPRAAELAARLPERKKRDQSNHLICPMPGILVSLSVEQGQSVEAGAPLCNIEAMKMENTLRAERACIVKAIHAAPGDSLALGTLIMEFAPIEASS